MNKLTQLFLVLLLACLPVGMMAQDNDDDADDSRYLVGAVPEVDGKVVFSKEFSIPGLSQEQVYERILKWMTQRLKENKNVESRVVYSEADKGTIAGVSEEWMVFKSSALSLDRSQINYQITVACQPAKCVVEIEKVRYTYREKEKYTAEEWITDKYALNKAQTKLVRGLAKWRKKTVDLTDELFAGAAKALGAPDNQPEVEKATPVKKSPAIATGPVVITQATTTEPTTVPATKLTPAIAIDPSATSSEMPGYQAVIPAELPANAIQMSTGKLVIAIGNDAFNMTMMTANAGGSLGKVGGKPVVFSILSPDQAYEPLEKAETYTVRFYQTNKAEASVILECKKLPSQAPMEGQPRTYVGEIIKAWIK